MSTLTPEHIAFHLGRIEGLEREHQKKIREEWMEVGQQMRAARENAGISLRALARHLGISAPYLSHMERGFLRYKVRHAHKALALFSIKPTP